MRVEEDVLGSLPTLIVRIVSTDVKQHLMKNTHTHTELRSCVRRGECPGLPVPTRTHSTDVLGSPSLIVILSLAVKQH